MKNEKTMTLPKRNESMYLVVMLSGYFLSVLLLYTIFQFLNLTKNCFTLIQIISIVLPIIVYLKKGKSNPHQKYILFGFLFLLLVLPFLYNKTFDITCDGNSYHKTAIAFIKNGWNPLYEDSRSFQEKNKNVIPIAEDTNIDLWIEHYPKATWILAATIYNMTGNIESGKCITFIFSLMLWIISYYCLRKIIDKKWSILVSSLIVFNPVVLSQIFSYYVDGIMGIFFGIELFLLFLVNPMKKQNPFLWLMMIACCTIFSNLKFTGLMCSGVIAAIFYFYWFWKYRKEKDFPLRFRNITFHFIFTFLIAILIVGSNSYIKNLVDHHNPLYPLMGEGKVDIITTMQPKSFENKTAIEKWMISLFSRTKNVTYYDKAPILKLPFKVYRSEIDELNVPDIRIGGFGPLFALGLLASIITFGIAFVMFIKKKKKSCFYVILPILSILLSMILLKESWWARYVPQFYLLPVGAILLGGYVLQTIHKNKWLRGCIWITVLILCMNVGIFLYASSKQIVTFKEINDDLVELSNMDNVKLKISTSDLYGYYYTLNDHNIHYQVVDQIDQEKMRYMYSWRLEVEINE